MAHLPSPFPLPSPHSCPPEGRPSISTPRHPIQLLWAHASCTCPIGGWPANGAPSTPLPLPSPQFSAAALPRVGPALHLGPRCRPPLPSSGKAFSLVPCHQPLSAAHCHHLHLGVLHPLFCVCTRVQRLLPQNGLRGCNAIFSRRSTPPSVRSSPLIFSRLMGRVLPV